MKKVISYVSDSYLRKSAKLLKELKLYTYRKVLAKKYDSIVDLGCGPGIDTVAMAMNAPQETRIFGVDIDADMVEKANAWAFANQVDHRVKHIAADITDLPFESESVGILRSERLFQHLSESGTWKKAFKECHRVLQNNGLMILADTDWASASVDFPDADLERRMNSYFAKNLITNGYSGRQLYSYFKNFGFKEIEVKVIPIHFNQLDYTPFGKYLTKQARGSAQFSEDELNYWLETLKALDQEKRFYCSLNMVVVSGYK